MVIRGGEGAWHGTSIIRHCFIPSLLRFSIRVEIPQGNLWLDVFS